jgi:8-oxo-dGTP diphosphatase
MSPQDATNLVSGILIKKEQILLGLRKNTKHFPGYWSLPVGHIELGESSLQAIKRELSEEIGVEVTKATPFSIKTDESESIYHQVFQIKSWNGKVVNREHNLCSELKWFSFNELPDNLTPVSKEIINDFKSFVGCGF